MLYIPIECLFKFVFSLVIFVHSCKLFTNSQFESFTANRRAGNQQGPIQVVGRRNGLDLRRIGRILSNHQYHHHQNPSPKTMQREDGIMQRMRNSNIVNGSSVKACFCDCSVRISARNINMTTKRHLWTGQWESGTHQDTALCLGARRERRGQSWTRKRWGCGELTTRKQRKQQTTPSHQKLHHNHHYKIIYYLLKKENETNKIGRFVIKYFNFLPWKKCFCLIAVVVGTI